MRIAADADLYANPSEIVRANLPLRAAIDESIESWIIKELQQKAPVFDRAYSVDGLTLEEFDSFEPIQLFRNAFLKGWYLLMPRIAARKRMFAL